MYMKVHGIHTIAPSIVITWKYDAPMVTPQGTTVNNIWFLSYLFLIFSGGSRILKREVPL